MKQASAPKLIVGIIVVLAIVLAVGSQRETTVVFAQPSYTSSNLSTPTRNQCSSCHSGSAASGGSAVVSFPSGTTYTPGVKQHLTVKITDPTHARGGYQLTARLASSLTSQAGTFAATDSNSNVVANGSIQDMNATNYATLTWGFDWTPPATASGNINFYLTGLATGSPGGSTSGNGVYQSVATLTPAAVADFSLSASPSSLTIVQGASGTSTVSVSALNGFAGSVGLSASGLPSGVTASFNPSSTTSSSTLTLTASSTATTGTASVTITGTSGSLSHTTTVALTVTAAPNFSLSASPGSIAITQGSSGTSTVSVAALNGFTGSVGLAASGLPSGVTASFNPASTTTTSVLTLTVASSAATGTATITITGTSGSLSHTTTMALTVNPAPDFSLSASPGSVSIAQGSSGTSTVSVAALNGFAGSLGLAASGLPSGVTASFNPASATTSSTLTLTVSNSAATGTAAVTITGVSGSLSHTATLSLTVTPPSDFSLLASPTSLTLAQGFSGSSTITVGKLNGFTGSVSLAASGLPSGVTASFSPSSATSSSTLTLTASSSAVTGATTITVTGTSGSLSHTTTLALTVSATAAPDFSLSASPASVAVARGASGTSTVSVVPQNGFTSTVNLSASGLPSGVTASFSPAAATSGSALTLTASSSAVTGPATVTITGTSGSLSHTTTLALTVSLALDFSLSNSPTSLTITQGSSGSSTVAVTALNGFTGSVSLAASGLPTGVTASFSPAAATSNSTLTLAASNSATTGAATVTITGTSGSLSHTATLTLSVNPAPDFSLSTSPTNLSITQGTSGTDTVSVSALNGFTGSVNLAASGLPSGVTASFSPNPAASSSTLTLTASSSAPTNTTTVTITGTAGSLSHTATLALTVNQTIPTLTVTPATLTFNYQIGSPVPGPQTISIAAGSSATALTVATGGSTWLAATPSTGTTPGAVSVSVTPNTLAAGTYNDAITIAAPGAAGSPETVAITLVVTSDTSTRKVSTTPASAFPSLVIDSNGNYDLAWTDTAAGVFFSRSTNQGATFPASVAIPGSVGAAFQPQFVVDSTGNNIDVVWAQPTATAGSYNVLFSRSTDGGQHFASTPTTLTRAALPLSDAPRIALEPNGGVDVVWGRNETWVTRSSDSATFPSSAVLISTATQDSGGARIAIDSKGNIYIVWSDEVNKLASGSYCKLTTTGTTSTFTNTAGGNFYFNVTASGGAFAANNTRNFANTDWAGVSAKWQPGFFGCSYDSLLLLIDSQDNLHMIWSTDSPDQNVLASSYPAASAAGNHRASFPAILNATPAASPHAVVTNNNNGTPTVHVIWSDGPSDLGAQASAGIFYTHSSDTATPYGQAFAPPTRVSTVSSEFPQVGVDSGGNVNAAWQQSAASTANAFDVMLASSFDNGNTFAAPITMSELPSNECPGTNKTDTTQIPPPPYNTCGSVQLKVDSGNASNLAWVNLSTSASDVIFARQVSTPPPGDFTMSIAAASQTLTNGAATYALTLTAANGFSQSITVLCGSGLPAGVACSPVHATPTAPGTAVILNLMMTGALPAGTYPFTIRGDAGLTTHSVQATLVVNNSAAPDFSISVSPTSLTALPGQSVTLTATLGSIAGFNSAVTLACAGLPAGATCSVNPPSVVAPGSATLTVTFPPSVGPGAYAFAITGASTSANHSQVATMALGAINASVSPGGSATIAVGSSANFAITLGATGGTSGPVSLGCAGLPAGLTCTFNPALLNLPASGTVSTNLTVRVNAKPAATPLHIQLPTEPPSTRLSWLITAMLMMLVAMKFGYRSRLPWRMALVRGFAMWLLMMALGMSLVSCAGVAGNSGASTGGPAPSSSSPAVSSTQITLQAQSGNVTMNLATLSINVP